MVFWIIFTDTRRLIRRIIDDEVFALGSQLAYSLLLSFFPFLIFLFTLIGFSPIKGNSLVLALKDVLPADAYNLISRTVYEIVEKRSGELLSLSIIFTIWSASNGFGAVIRGLNKAYDVEETRNFVKLKLISIVCTLALAVTILASLVLWIFGDYIGEFLRAYIFHSYAFMKAWNIIRFIVVMLITITVFAALYRYTPCKRLKWMEVMPGALFTTLGWILSSAGFTFYVNNFSNYTRIYGSLGAVIILMTWLFLTSVIILIGGELNATLAFDKEGREKPQCKKY